MTKEQLKQCMPMATTKNLDKFLEPLNKTFLEFEINTPARQAMFLAQICHESGSLKYVKELASGEAYDTGKLAASLGNTPEKDGDGQKFKGRGLLQITGKSNYFEVGKALGIDLIKNPELLEEPLHAARSAGWFWKKRALSILADKNDDKSFLMVTKKINGGFNGLEDRLVHWGNAKKALNLA